jgi:CheY-like chemotaxis protein
VTLFLPRASNVDHQPCAEVEMESAAGGTVLVVEDNPDVAEVTSSMLSQLGYDVHTAADTAAALAILERHNFDLVVSDIVMPGPLDGLGLARALRDREPNLPVLLVTGYSHAATQADESLMVMRKPFQLADLSRVAARMIAEAKQPATSNLVRLSDARRIVRQEPQ